MNNTNRAELLPCPFCGAGSDRIILGAQEPHTHALSTFMPDHPGSATIECGGCIVGMIDDSVDQVIAAWNRRAQPERVASSEVNQLRLQNEYLLTVYDAAKNLVKVKGRHHSEQAYKSLVNAIDEAAIPALPPITQPLIAEAARDDGPNLTSTNIPEGDAYGRTLDRLYAAFHREPCGDTLAAIGCAIQELQALEAVKRDDVAGDAKDARRYRGITTRYGYSLYTRYISTDGGYSSNGAKEKLDAWADAAADEVEKYDAMTIEEKQADMQRQLDAAIAASKEQK